MKEIKTSFQERFEAVKELIGTFEADLAYAEYKKDLVEKKALDLEREITHRTNVLRMIGMRGPTLKDAIDQVIEAWRSGQPYPRPKNLSGLIKPCLCPGGPIEHLFVCVPR